MAAPRPTVASGCGAVGEWLDSVADQLERQRQQQRVRMMEAQRRRRGVRAPFVDDDEPSPPGAVSPRVAPSRHRDPHSPRPPELSAAVPAAELAPHYPYGTGVGGLPAEPGRAVSRPLSRPLSRAPSGGESRMPEEEEAVARLREQMGQLEAEWDTERRSLSEELDRQRRENRELRSAPHQAHEEASARAAELWALGLRILSGDADIVARTLASDRERELDDLKSAEQRELARVRTDRERERTMAELAEEARQASAEAAGLRSEAAEARQEMESYREEAAGAAREASGLREELTESLRAADREEAAAQRCGRDLRDAQEAARKLRSQLEEEKALREAAEQRLEQEAAAPRTALEEARSEMQRVREELWESCRDVDALRQRAADAERVRSALDLERKSREEGDRAYQELHTRYLSDIQRLVERDRSLAVAEESAQMGEMERLRAELNVAQGERDAFREAARRAKEECAEEATRRTTQAEEHRKELQEARAAAARAVAARTAAASPPRQASPPRPLPASPLSVPRVQPRASVILSPLDPGAAQPPPPPAIHPPPMAPPRPPDLSPHRSPRRSPQPSPRRSPRRGFASSGAHARLERERAQRAAMAGRLRELSRLSPERQRDIEHAAELQRARMLREQWSPPRTRSKPGAQLRFAPTCFAAEGVSVAVRAGVVPQIAVQLAVAGRVLDAGPDVTATATLEPSGAVVGKAPFVSGLAVFDGLRVGEDAMGRRLVFVAAGSTVATGALVPGGGTSQPDVDPTELLRGQHKLAKLRLDRMRKKHALGADQRVSPVPANLKSPPRPLPLRASPPPPVHSAADLAPPQQQPPPPPPAPVIIEKHDGRHDKPSPGENCSILSGIGFDFPLSQCKAVDKPVWEEGKVVLGRPIDVTAFDSGEALLAVLETRLASVAEAASLRASSQVVDTIAALSEELSLLRNELTSPGGRVCDADVSLLASPERPGASLLSPSHSHLRLVREAVSPPDTPDSWRRQPPLPEAIARPSDSPEGPAVPVAAAAAAALAVTTRAAVLHDVPEPGSVVRVQGLVRFPELNGAHVRVKEMKVLRDGRQGMLVEFLDRSQRDEILLPQNCGPVQDDGSDDATRPPSTRSLAASVHLPPVVAIPPTPPAPAGHPQNVSIIQVETEAGVSFCTPGPRQSASVACASVSSAEHAAAPARPCSEPASDASPRDGGGGCARDAGASGEEDSPAPDPALPRELPSEGATAAAAVRLLTSPAAPSTEGDAVLALRAEVMELRQQLSGSDRKEEMTTLRSEVEELRRRLLSAEADKAEEAATEPGTVPPLSASASTDSATATPTKADARLPPPRPGACVAAVAAPPPSGLRPGEPGAVSPARPPEGLPAARPVMVSPARRAEPSPPLLPQLSRQPEQQQGQPQPQGVLSPPRRQNQSRVLSPSPRRPPSPRAAASRMSPNPPLSPTPPDPRQAERRRAAARRRRSAAVSQSPGRNRSPRRPDGPVAEQGRRTVSPSMMGTLRRVGAQERTTRTVSPSRHAGDPG
eukprot:TRINITY_DN4231_c0_g2_i1.p1 TRINITY_DN4231_c0_g2~~TRINITY_DN4231_c0_g2_i1.p1  ORF type:complete len:1532 (+),score=468.91 TRINITY_DN4231_c0_g2_i1:66-4598(+)